MASVVHVCTAVLYVCRKAVGLAYVSYWQYALNVEEYKIAQKLRNKLTEVDAEVIKQQEAKRGSASKNLQDAIQSENYTKAASLRDEISELESQSLAVTIKAQAYINTQFAYRLGQKLRHKKFGYRAVVCGMDPVCTESSSWMESAQVAKLKYGPNQPFYQCRKKIYRIQTNQTQSGLSIRMLPFYSMGWMQLGTSSRSSSCERSSTSLDMKCHMALKMNKMDKMVDTV